MSDGGGTVELDRAIVLEMVQLSREQSAKLTEAVKRLTGIAEAMTAQNAVIAKQDRRARWQTWAAAAVVLALITLGAAQWSNRQVIHALEDCTRPGGQCFAEGQARQARIVGPVADSLSRIEARANDTRRLICLGIPEAERPPELCPR